MTVRLTPAAEADVEAILEWYRSRGQELRDQFQQAFDRSLEFIQDNPQSCATIHGEIRRVLLRRFPYCVFYILESNEIVVLACMHGHSALQPTPGASPGGRRSPSQHFAPAAAERWR